MAKVNAIKTSFNAGEITPKALGRVDLEASNNGCKTILNGIVTAYGNDEKRGGSVFVTDNAPASYFSNVLFNLGITETVNSICIDSINEKYVFGCNSGKLVTCGFDFDNLATLTITVPEGKSNNIISVAKGQIYNSSGVLIDVYAICTTDYFMVTTTDLATTVYESAVSGLKAVFNTSYFSLFDGVKLYKFLTAVDGTVSFTNATVRESAGYEYSIYSVNGKVFLYNQYGSGQTYLYSSDGVSFTDTNISTTGKSIISIDYTDSKYNVYTYGTTGSPAKTEVECYSSSDLTEFTGILLFSRAADTDFYATGIVRNKRIFISNNYSVYLKGSVWLDDAGIKSETAVNGIINTNNLLLLSTTLGNIEIISGQDANLNKGFLVSFKVNKNINYILEFGDKYIRFYKNRTQLTSGDYVYSVTTPYLLEDIVDSDGKPTLWMEQNGDILYLAHKEYPTYRLVRYGDTNWVYEAVDIVQGPFDKINIDVNKVLTSVNTSGLITVNAVTGNSHCSITSYITRVFATNTTTPNRTRWYLDNSLIATANYFLSIQDAVNLLLGTADGANFDISYSGNTINITVKSSAGTSYNGKVLKLYRWQIKQSFPDIPYYYQINEYINEATFIASSASTNVFETEDKGKLLRINYNDSNTTMWQTGIAGITIGVVRKSGFNYYRSTTTGTTGQIKPIHTAGSVSDGGVVWEYLHSGYGVGVIMEVVSASQIKLNVDGFMPDISVGTYLWEKGLIGKGGVYPSKLVFFRERMCLILELSDGVYISTSCTGDYLNFADKTFGEILAENAITLPLSGEQINTTNWLIAKGQLFIGTAGEEYIFGEQTIADVLSPTNVSSKSISKDGSSNLRPLEISDEILFTNKSGTEICNMLYFSDKDSFRPVSISTLFEHLLHHDIKSWAYASAPNKMIWCVNNKGELFSIAYDADQKVCGAARHNIAGIVESVAVIPSPNGNYDDVWMIVKREIDGQTVRYIEYFSYGLPILGDLTDDVLALSDTELKKYLQKRGVFVDCAKVYEFETATATIENLYHLEGQTVKVLANGKVHPVCVVTDGKITLNYTANVVIVGIGFSWIVETLYLNVGGQRGSSQGLPQRCNKMTLRLLDTLDLKAKCTGGADFENIVSGKIGAEEEQDEMFTGDKKIDVPSDYDEAMTITLKSEEPLPCSVLAIVAELTTYD